MVFENMNVVRTCSTHRIFFVACKELYESLLSLDLIYRIMIFSTSGFRWRNKASKGHTSQKKYELAIIKRKRVSSIKWRNFHLNLKGSFSSLGSSGSSS